MNNINYEFNKLFYSVDNKHIVEISIIDDIAWFNINKLDYENFKTFIILLKDIIKVFSNNNISYVKQYINKEDYEFFNKSSFIEYDENIYVVSTKLIDFLPEIIDVLNIKKM